MNERDNRPTASTASSAGLFAELPSLLRPFLDQCFPVRSITVVSSDPTEESRCEALLHKVAPDQRDLVPAGAPLLVAPFGQLSDGDQAQALPGLGRYADELASGSPGNDVLVAPTGILEAMMTPLAEDLGFRAVAALSSHAASQPGKGDHWKLRRDLFDRGLVGIGSVQGGNLSSQCFLASDAIRNANRLDAGSRGQITISSLGRNGRFANQLFQYAFVKLYALRHGLSAAVPDWQGRDLFDLRDAFSAGITLPRLEFAAFKDSDRRLWEVRDPPIDIDVLGYFQEIPECWRPHRSLLRSMFALPVERQDSLDAWRDDLTIGGQRTLVAAHVRRTDYRDSDLPYFRIVPDAWYLSWLRTIWPTLREPLLFVATDEPDQVLSIFEEFAPISTLDWPATQLPEHVRDFEVLRRADYLAICNSSFSRMAAILAPANQRCFLPSFPEQRLVPYEPWIDPGFWARFADPSPDSEDHERTARGDEDAEFQNSAGDIFRRHRPPSLPVRPPHAFGNPACAM